MQVKSTPEIYYVCCWHDRATDMWHPNMDTLAHTTNLCNARANKILGLTTRQRAARGFRIMPFRVTLVPAWADEVLKTERPVLAALEDQPTGAIYLPRDLADKLRAFCELRGTTVADLVRISLTRMLRANKYHDLDTPLGFGKYAGERMEAIVRLDPGYVRWALDNIEGLVVGDGVIELLDSMLKLQQNGASAPEK